MKRHLLTASAWLAVFVLGLALFINFTSSRGVSAQDHAISKTVNWRQQSESQAYPNLKKYKHVWIYVSTKQQKVYFHGNGHVIYTMICSTGKPSSPTPKGTYHIQAQRGLSFYNAASGEGAHYWVSWKGHGIYLFHSVPVNRSGKYIPSEAEKLGTPASHGCVRLTVADAHWVYQHVPYGMKVVIK